MASAPGLSPALDGMYNHNWSEHKENAAAFVKGKWRQEEDEHLIRHFFALAASEHGMSREEAVRLVTEGVKRVGIHRKGFWLKLARRFRWRSVKDIFYHADSVLPALLGVTRPGDGPAEAAAAAARVGGVAWTDDDMDALRKAELAARGKPGKWTGVAAVMGRPRNACRLQWVKHFGDEAQALKQAGKASGHFSEEEEQRLREAYAAEKAAASTGQTAISWTNIGRAVGTRTGPECWSKWNRTEFGNTEEGASWSAEEDAAVLAGLEAEDADRWQDVDWEAVASHPGLSRDPAVCRRRVAILARRKAGGYRLNPVQLCEALCSGRTAMPSVPAAARASKPAKKSRPAKGATAAAARKAAPAEADGSADEDEEQDVAAAFAKVLDSDSDDE